MLASTQGQCTVSGSKPFSVVNMNCSLRIKLTLDLFLGHIGAMFILSLLSIKMQSVVGVASLDPSNLHVFPPDF